MRLFSGILILLLVLVGVFSCETPVSTISLSPTATPKYKVVYDANGGTGRAPVDTRSYVQGTSVTVLDANGGLTNSGYAFAGWTTNNTATGPSDSYGVRATLTMGSSDVTLYAVWVPSGLGFTPYANSIILQGYSLAPKGLLAIPPGITLVAPGCLNFCTGLTGVTIPSSVTQIGDRAFGGCTGLTSATIPDSVTRVGELAFGGCSSLTSITLPSSVTTIGDGLFSGCRALSSISVSSVNPNFASVDGVLFNKTLTTLIQVPGGLLGTYAIPSSVTSIANYAVSGCSSLTGVNIPSSVTSIGNYAFGGCRGLVGVTIPSGIVKIGTAAFEGCTRLARVEIPFGVTTVWAGSFASCTGLTNVIIPSSVTSIESGAFTSCFNLPSVTIPSSVTSIGNGAFAGCESLRSVTMQGSIPPSMYSSSWVFGDYPIGLVIHVPTSAVAMYKAAPGWSNYSSRIVGNRDVSLLPDLIMTKGP